MKNQIYFSVILVTAVLIISSCSKDDDNNPAPANSSIASVITTGSWRVSYFYESGSNQTAAFDGYTFTFNSNETMTATNAAGTTNGTWRIDDDGSNEFHMSIGSSSPLADISKGWSVLSQSSTEIRLKDDSSGGDEELHFTKI